MNLLTKIKSKKAVIGIVGLGYVGLPLAFAFRKKTTISGGTNLNLLVQSSIKNIETKYKLTSLRAETRSAFNIKSDFETFLFFIWRDAFPNLCENIGDMKERGLYADVMV